MKETQLKLFCTILIIWLMWLMMESWKKKKTDAIYIYIQKNSGNGSWKEGNFFDAKNVDINISHDKPEKKML